LLNAYGPTECAITATVFEVAPVQSDESASRLASGKIPIGRPLAHRSLYILDASGGLAPAGAPGELHIGGSLLARGYLNRPELTAERFIPNPFGDAGGARLYRTGDLARYRRDGEIEFLGRLDRQLKVRGYRIEPGEIEAALLADERVRACGVVGRNERPSGRRIVAYVVAEPGASVSEEELRRHLKERVPVYMLPSAFVLLDELPLNSNGKIDRSSLPEPEAARQPSAKSFVAPRTPEEEMLAEIWSELLGVSPVGAEDNFFELGGHSLLATRVVSRVREACGVELPLRLLFEAPTVAELAKHLAEAANGQGELERIEEMLKRLEHLSDTDVDALLGEMSGDELA
jgi:acyl carrier protein